MACLGDSGKSIRCVRGAVCGAVRTGSLYMAVSVDADAGL